MSSPVDCAELGLVVRRYEGFVRRLAHSLIGRLPASIELDDLLQVGRIAIWKAYPRFDPNVGGSIETFLTRRVMGSFLDYLRGTDYLSRSDRRALKRLDRSINGSPHINRTELVRSMGIDFDELERLLLLRDGTSVSGDESQFENGETLFELTPAPYGDPVNSIRAEECLACVEWAIRKASPVDVEVTRQVFERHFLDGQALAEVGEFLGVTESRVCQIAEKLRSFIKYRLRY